MDDESCRRERLAGTGGLAVDLCSCGCVHVTIGAVTLRLQPDAVAELAQVLRVGAAELAHRQVAAGRRRLASVLPS